MNLAGGLDIYRVFGDRYGSDIPPEGRKVKFLNKHGWGYDREYANRLMKEGEVFTVKEIYVGRSSSEVEFFELPNERFNTVMFEDVES